MAGDLTVAPRYVIADSSAVTHNATQMNMTISMTNNPAITSWQPGNNLIVSMNIYQNGILQFNVIDTSETWSRFRISDYDIGVEWSQLKHQTIDESSGSDYLITSQVDGITLTQQSAATGEDQFEVKIQYNPFRIQEWSNGQLLVEINSQDTLFFESGTDAIDQSISMGFFINA